MAEETKHTPPMKEEVVISPEVEKSVPEPEPVKEIPSSDPVPEPEKVSAPVAEEEEKEKESGDDKVAESASFKEESNVVADLPNPQQVALDEFKALVKSALEKHEFTPPPPPPPPPTTTKEPEIVAPVEEEKEENTEPVPESKPEEVEKKDPECAPVEVPTPKAEVVEKMEVVETKAEVVVEKTEQKIEVVEEIKETIVEVTTPPPPPVVEPTEEEKTAPEPEPETEATPPPPPPPEEVSIWGIKLLEDDKSDSILLKFLRARDFKVKEAFYMLKSVVQWRKEFGIDSLIEEDATCEGLDKVVYLHGIDKEGHLVLYNSFGEFQDKELYQNTFADAEKRTKFLRGIIQFFEKTIRNLDFTPDGICTLFQVIDLKNSPGLFFFKKDLRQAISHALQLFQDNYPEFVAKQVYINVPWWFRAYYSMINAIFTPRTKSKFIFAGPSKSAEILFKYIAPEKVPVGYGGLSFEGESEFTSDDSATEVTIKPASSHTIEFEVTEKCTLVWELRVVGWEVSYGAEFVPSAEGGYTVILQKTRKVVPTDEPIISSSYSSGEPGKVVLTINNQSSKRKNLVYRSKNKSSD